MAVRGAGNVKAPAPHHYGQKERSFIRVPLRTSAHKEGAVAMIGEWSPQPPQKKTTNKQQEETPARKKKKTLQAQPSEEKER
jgi:hypothetical protein